MKLKELKEKLLTLNTIISDIENDHFQLCFHIGSNLCDSLIGIVFYEKDDKIFMTDDYFFIENFAGDNEIGNYQPLEKIEKFAGKYDINFNLKIEKELDLKDNIARQVKNFFKVELYADMILSENKNIAEE